MTISYCYDEPAKQTAARRAKTQLRKVATALGLTKGQFDLRWNPGGIAVWGEVTLHSDSLYIQYSHTDLGVLVRTCTSRKDYTGGPNCWVNADLLPYPEAFAAKVRSVTGVAA